MDGRGSRVGRAGGEEEARNGRGEMRVKRGEAEFAVERGNE